MLTESKKSLFADLGLLLAAVIWGSAYFVNKGVLQHIHPVTILGVRFAIASLLLGTGLVLVKKNPFRRPIAGFILGAILWLSFCVQLSGLIKTTASNSGFITSLFVVFTPLLSFLFLKKPLGIQRMIAIPVSTVGLWLIAGGVQAINMGDLLTLLSALMIAVYLLVAGHFAKEKSNPLVLAFQQFFSAAVLSGVAILVLGLPTEIHLEKTIYSIGYIAIFQTLVAFGLQIISQQRTDPVRVSLILALEAVFAAIFAWTFGNETIILTRAIGGLLIFVATLIADPQVFAFLMKCLGRAESRTEAA